MVSILSALWRIKIRGLWKLPDGRTDCGEKLGLVLMGGAMLSKSLIQFPVVVLGCVPSLLFDLRQNCGGSNEDNGDLLQKIFCRHCCIQCPRPCSMPLLTHSSAGNSSTLTGKSGSVSCGVTAPFSWVLGQTRLFVPSKSLFPQSCGSSVIKSRGPPKSNSLGIPCPFARSPGWEICCGS